MLARHVIQILTTVPKAHVKIMQRAKMGETGISVIVYRVIPVLHVKPKSMNAYQDHVSVALVLIK